VHGNQNHLPEPPAGDIADDDITALRQRQSSAAANCLHEALEKRRANRPPGIPAYVLLTLPTTIVQLSIVPAGNQIAG